MIGQSKKYTYDDWGNILTKKVYNGTSVSESNLIQTINYTYPATGWKDKLTSYNGQSITYDAIGNPTSYRGAAMSWFGRQLESYSKSGTTVGYTYDSDGLRVSKTVNNVKHNYYYVEGKLVYEDCPSYKLFYLYDALGNLAQIRRLVSGNQPETFNVVCNSFGDVIALYEGADLLAKYTYDSWGKLVSIIDWLGQDVTTTNDIWTQNSIRYRGYVYDTETALYYLQSRYYDPETCRFINADDTAYLGGDNAIQCYNLFAYSQCNPITMRDDGGDWPSWATKVLIGTAVIAAAAILTVATAGTGTALACFAVGALKGAVSGALIGAASGGAIGAVGHRLKTGSWEGAGQAALNGAADGYMSGAITGFISGGLTSNACFVAGTVVLTAAGTVAIEDVKAGDMVYATDPETGETALKEVVQTFVNESLELVHVTVCDEEIVCTNEHPFYSPKKGWTAAFELRAGDILVTVNGEYVTVEKVQHEILEAPIKVYNFEVADYHTYYVSDRRILVHNVCRNPGGRHGGPAHRAKIEEVKASLTKKGWKVSDVENRIGVGGGKYRYPDIIARKGDIRVFYQIGRATKSGRPVARELRALYDLSKKAATFFIRYN